MEKLRASGTGFNGLLDDDDDSDSIEDDDDEDDSDDDDDDLDLTELTRKPIEKPGKATRGKKE